MPGFEIELVLPLSILMLFASKSSHTSVQEKRTVRPILRKADHVPRSGFKKGGRQPRSQIDRGLRWHKETK